MNIRVRDKQAEGLAWREQEEAGLACAVKPFPNNVPDFIPFVDISCYREIETENLYFDEKGDLSYGH